MNHVNSMMISDDQEADRSQEYPLSGTSSTEALWDDLSDNDLLQMLEESVDDPESQEIEETPETSNIYLINCTDETLHMTKKGSQWKDQTRSYQTLDNHFKEELSDDNVTANHNSVLQSETRANLVEDVDPCVIIAADDDESMAHSSDDAQENDVNDPCVKIAACADEPTTSSDDGVTHEDRGVNDKRATCECKPGTLSSEAHLPQEGDDDVKYDLVRAICDEKPEMDSSSEDDLQEDLQEDDVNGDPLKRTSDRINDLSPAKRRKVFTPFELFRGKYLCVTDLTSQAWCEQALVYSFTREPTVEVDSTSLDTGASIHLARELEVHDIEAIPVTSNEDKFSVKLLNMLTSIIALSSWSIIRELPVFGELPNSSMFVSGIIDEIKYTDKGELQLTELKTKTLQKAPSRAQFKTHSLQVMLYKHLFDSLVKGSLSRDKVLAHMNLDAAKPLGKDVMECVTQRGLECSVFGDLLDLVLLRFQFADLPLIDSLKIEYCYQATCEPITDKYVQMDADWLNQTLEHYLKFWNGTREAEGVDVEDAWKCHSCAYYDACEWVEKKTKELTLKNKINNSMSI